MTYKKFIRLLESHTSIFRYESQLKFALLICQKLYFDYQKFHEVYSWGDPNLMMDAIVICQRAIHNQVDINEIKDLLLKIDLIVPDMEHFGSEIRSYALNASTAVYETLQFITDNDKIHIYNIATYYTDTIHLRIQEEKTLTKEEIENHPLMIEAWNFVIEQTK